MPYVRLRIAELQHQQISEAAAMLQEKSDGVFYSQLDARAGLGCHPFHLTVVAGLQSYWDEEVQQALSNLVASQQLCELTDAKAVRWEMGHLSLRLAVQSGQLDRISHMVKQVLPRGKRWVPRHGLYHITIGTYVGEQKARFLREVANAFPPDANFVFACREIEYENDVPTRPNPPILPLTGRMPPAIHTSPNVESLMARVYAMCGRCGAFVCRAHRTGTGFISLQPINQQIVSEVRLIHDLLHKAYQSNPVVTLQLLEHESNAYANHLSALSPADFTWRSKMEDLHISVARESAVTPGQMNVVTSSRVCQAEHNSPYLERTGHGDTRSSLLCYRSGANAWITLHLSADILLAEGLLPGDYQYFHMSLAKLQFSKARAASRY